MLNKIDVLSEILGSIQRLYDSGDNVLTQGDILNAIQVGQEERFEDDISSTSLIKLGPGGMVFSVSQVEPTNLPVLFVNKGVLHSTQEVKSHLRVNDLQAIFEKCRIISFADWASFDGASDLWDRLRTEVIKPLERHDFEFIFYIGDTTGKPSFEIDEILDIMSAFSFNGNVTLLLRAEETSKLCKALRGDAALQTFSHNDDPGQFIFNTMNIHRLLVYFPNHRMTIFSREGRQEWMGYGASVPNIPGASRIFFNIGFILGLLLQLSTVHCTALGLALSDAYLRNDVIPDLKTLHSYIKNLINELSQNLVEH